MFRKMVAFVVCLFLIMSNLVISTPVFAEADEFDALREKWVETLTGGTEFDASDPLFAEQIKANTDTAMHNQNTMEKGTERTYLWSDLPSKTSSQQVTSGFKRIYQMALAYKTKSSSLENDKALLADIISALQWMNSNRFSKDIREYDNWWDWDIGSPLCINDTLCLLYNDLPTDLIKNYTDAIEYYEPDPTKCNGNISTGANRVWVCNVVAGRGIIVKDSNKIALARDSLTPVFLYVTSGDGFYEDGSFIQHGNIAYTGAYGVSLINDISDLMYLLNDSKWEVVAPNKSNVFKWISDSFEPIVYKGFLMDMVRGREISRYSSNGNSTGKSLMSALVMLAQVAPEAEKEAIGGMLKSWSGQNTYMNFYKGQPIFRIKKARELVAGAKQRSNFIGLKMFPAMDRMVMHREGFALGLAMYSSRTASYETLNKENLLGYYTAAGALYLHNNDFAKYADDYWATVDPFRLPGVTALSGQTIANSIGQNYAGGASLGNMFGVAGIRFMPGTYSLDAKKSYFMFDDEIVAIGTVNSNDEFPAETTMENYKINGDNALIADGQSRATTNGKTDPIENAKWIHLSGNVSGSDIGFYMPEQTTVKALRQTRTSSWASVNKNYITPENSQSRTKSYMTLWLDHGVAPIGKTYSYVMLPNKSASEVEQYANNPDIEVVKNTEFTQAVREKKLGITAANFFLDDEAAGIKSNTRASVIMRQTGDELQIAVADPTQANNRNIVLEIDKVAAKAVELDPNVTVLAYAPKLTVSVDTSKKNGMSSNMKIKLYAPLSFTDLPASHWAYGYAAALFYSGAVSGTSETKFEPEANVTREQFIKMLVSALGILDKNAACEFSDINKGEWFYPYVATAAKVGIIRGNADGSFGLGKNITRQEMAVMINSCGLDLKKKILGFEFSDQKEIAPWAKDAITAVSRAKIMSGYQGGAFGPNENATRAEAVKVIFNVLQAKG